MLRNSALVLIPIALVACSGPRFVVRAGLDSINPTLAAPTGPLPLIASENPDVPHKGPGKKGGSGRTGASDVNTRDAAKPERTSVAPEAPGKRSAGGNTAPVDRLPPGVVQSADNSFGSAQTMSMVPASGDQRSRLLRSATRLVGIRKSFDQRSFLGHLLAICDLLPGGRTSVDWSSGDQMDQARAAGIFREAPGKASPGDIVFFRCPSGCGADAADGIGVGVVVDTEGGRTAFIAYRNAQVDRFDATDDELIGYCAP